MEAQIIEFINRVVGFTSKHFDVLITVSVTILGFIISGFATRKSFRNEILKSKIEINAEVMKTFPYDVCNLMNRMISAEKLGLKPVTPADLSELHSKILAYGSKQAVEIAIHLQQLSYQNNGESDPEKTGELMAAYSLLIAQIKYDLTAEIISPDSWLRLRIKDYETLRSSLVKNINRLVKELNLDTGFIIGE